jgi:hypothetical protein
MISPMGRNIIVSEETVQRLLEEHASLSAWYYEHLAALRAANTTGLGPVPPPDDAARSAFVEGLLHDFPDLAQVVRAIRVPRAYVPPPPPGSLYHQALSFDEPATLVEPAPARARSVHPEAATTVDPVKPRSE